jgi:hypothetical protein
MCPQIANPKLQETLEQQRAKSQIATFALSPLPILIPHIHGFAISGLFDGPPTFAMIEMTSLHILEYVNCAIK